MPRISMAGFVYSREAWELTKDKLARSEPRWHDASRLQQAIKEVEDLVRSKNFSDQDIIDLLVASELELGGESPSGDRINQLGSVVRQALREETGSKDAETSQAKPGGRRKAPKKESKKNEQASEIGGDHQKSADGKPDTDTPEQPGERPAEQPAAGKEDHATEKAGGSAREASGDRAPDASGEEVPKSKEPISGKANEPTIPEGAGGPNDTGVPEVQRQATSNAVKSGSGVWQIFAEKTQDRASLTTEVEGT